MSEDFVKGCIEDMARKDLFGTMLYILRAPPNQQRTLRKWALEAVGIKERRI